MPNRPVPAAAEGVSENQDPLLDAIRAYREGLADFERNHPRDDDERTDAFAAATYAPPLARLSEWREPAASLEGAVEALRLALNDTGGVKDTEAGERMVAAALAFLERKQAPPQTAMEEAEEAAWSLLDLQDRLGHVRSLVTLVEYALEGMGRRNDEQVNALQTGMNEVYEGVTSAEEMLKLMRGAS